MSIFAVLMLMIGTLFALAACICLIDRKPGIAGMMAFTSAIVVCSVAMAVM